MDSYKYILDSLKFLPEEVIRHDDANGQYILKGDFKGRLVLLKIIALKNKAKAENLNKEYLVTTELFKNKFFGDGLLLEKDKKFVWYIREFIEGKSLSQYNGSQLVALYDYDILDSALASKSSAIVPEISNLLKSVRTNKTKTSFPTSLLSKRWSVDLENYDIEAIEKGVGSSLSRSASFYNAVKKAYLAPEKTAICLGDLVPANILFNDRTGKINFIDLEWVCLDNIEMDASFLWLFLWRYPEWQKKLLNFFGNGIDKDSFRASVIRQIIGWYDPFFRPKTISKENGQIKIYHDHIWVKYMIVAGESYEKLISIR